MKPRLPYIERQVYICFDGPDGLVIQTSIETYNSYYKLLGWELMGRATPLAGMLGRTYQSQVEEVEPETEPAMDTMGSQKRLL